MTSTDTTLSLQERRDLHVAYLNWRRYTKWWRDRELATLFESLGLIPHGVPLNELNRMAGEVGFDSESWDVYKENMWAIDQIRNPYNNELRHGSDAYHEYIADFEDPYLLQGDMESPVLYHLTSFLSLYSILHDDALLPLGDTPDKLFFTTNPDLIEMNPVFYWGEFGRNATNLSVRITLDFEKLKSVEEISFVPGSATRGTYCMEEENIATAPDGLRELSAYTLYVDIKKSRFTCGDLQTHIDVQAYRYYNVPLPNRLKEVEEMLTQQGTPYTIRP